MRRLLTVNDASHGAGGVLVVCVARSRIFAIVGVEQHKNEHAWMRGFCLFDSLQHLRFSRMRSDSASLVRFERCHKPHIESRRSSVRIDRRRRMTDRVESHGFKFNSTAIAILILPSFIEVLA